jgi:hypothetical protein
MEQLKNQSKLVACSSCYFWKKNLGKSAKKTSGIIKLSNSDLKKPSTDKK